MTKGVGAEFPNNNKCYNVWKGKKEKGLKENKRITLRNENEHKEKCGSCQ